MLQWTGGSRRKVATTRKSTYNRQRQYFEQKKRQQQTCRPQNYEYGKKKRIDDSEGPRSLDVLNLKNFTSSPQCCSNDHNGDNIFDVPKSLPAFQSNKTFPMYCYQPTDTRTGSFSNSHYEVLPQNKLSSASNLDKQQSIHNHCDGVGIRFGERKTQITSDSSSNTIKYRAGVSVLDLLNDDGYKNNSSVSSSHEAHVAFSVEGFFSFRIYFVILYLFGNCHKD
ncbi:hypothetical protein ZOSMA_56G01160 [Zostera marina]|uniref:Uncharacterized protein n=1 Tax=Zostera marina TaxID=29655 RepID=A0A0K9NY71_ZOSMR|nr:hypothetical protein ZOSMA_56G01160 [Zostera marina]